MVVQLVEFERFVQITQFWDDTFGMLRVGPSRNKRSVSLNELCFWTYPSSGVSRTNKIEEIKKVKVKMRREFQHQMEILFASLPLNLVSLCVSCNCCC
jgi:hypothetical protein